MKYARILRNDDVREMCISNELYTNGCNEEYYKMFEKCEGEITDEKLFEIATDIYDHSCTDMTVLDIANALNRRILFVGVWGE